MVALAAQNPCTNLDPYLLDNATLRSLFATSGAGFAGALIEGNRGLFDGKDVTGTCSTAELARILTTPVILAMDCTKMTRTAAAVLTGMLNFEEGYIFGCGSEPHGNGQAPRYFATDY